MIENMEVLEDMLIDDDGEDGALFLEPRHLYDRAIIGITDSGVGPAVVAYSSDGVIEALMEMNGWDRQEAAEFFEFNIVNAHVGHGSPVFVDLLRSAA